MDNEETYFSVLRALVASNQMNWVRGGASRHRRCAFAAATRAAAPLLSRCFRSIWSAFEPAGFARTS